MASCCLCTLGLTIGCSISSTSPEQNTFLYWKVNKANVWAAFSKAVMAQVQCLCNYNNLYSQLSHAERDLWLVEFKLYPICINLSCTLFILFFVCASGSHHIFVDLKIWVSSCFQCHCLICLNTLVYSCLVWALLSLHSVRLLLGAASTAAFFQNIQWYSIFGTALLTLARF